MPASDVAVEERPATSSIAPVVNDFSIQVATVNGCVESFQAMAARDADGSVARDMEEAGVTTHDVCRCALEELEERYSESDFLTLSPTEQHESTVEAVGKCGEELFAL